MVIDMPICANDAADMASITSANNSERMEGMIRIVLPLARSSLACPVMLSCSGLRGWRGTISGRNVLHTSSRSQMVLLSASHFGNFMYGQKCSVRGRKLAHQSAHFLTQEVSMNQSLMDPKLIVLAGRGDSGRRRAGS